MQRRTPSDWHRSAKQLEVGQNHRWYVRVFDYLVGEKNSKTLHAWKKHFPTGTFEGRAPRTKFAARNTIWGVVIPNRLRRRIEF